MTKEPTIIFVQMAIVYSIPNNAPVSKGNGLWFSSHKSTEWYTPDSFYDPLNEKYHFTLDVAATPENAKCAKYFTEEQDGLKQEWIPDPYDENTPGAIWCNPPYGPTILDWIKKAIACKHKVVMLLPVKTSNATFHDNILPNAKINFVRGHLKFGGYKKQAPFDSMLLEFN
jgi:site-specific DNA-methyltransferase (adenine-specific)